IDAVDVDVRIGIDGHEVVHLGDGVGALPARDEHEGVAVVASGGGSIRLQRPQFPAAVILVAEQRGERAGRVQSRQAQPVDAALPRDQSRGAAVAEQGVVLDAQSHPRSLPCPRITRQHLAFPAQPTSLCPMPTTTLFILGATGDLTSRLLLPSLAAQLGKNPERRVILRGAGTEDWDAATWRATVEKGFAGSAEALAQAEIADYVRADVTDAAAVASLVAGLAPSTVLYFALPPAVTGAAIDAMEGLALPEGTVLAMEKPFGEDEA